MFQIPKNIITAIFFVWLAMASMPSMGQQPPQIIEKADDRARTPKDLKSLINGNTQFALDLYKAFAKDQTKENIFFSPYSMSAAFAMLYEGARGKTAEEIQTTFHFPSDELVRKSGFASLYNVFNDPNASYQLSVANALWAQKDYPFSNDYLTLIKRFYRAHANNVDFNGATETTRNIINTWVQNNTQDKIKELFPIGSLSGLTRLALTNAVYFKGRWSNPFDKKNTQDEDFWVNPTTAIKIPMMRLTGSHAAWFGFGTTDTLQILELPYEGIRLSLLILLPKSKEGLGALENELSIEKLSLIRQSLKSQKMEVYLPRFTVKKTFSLVKTLSELGISSVFSAAGDLSGIDKTRQLFVGTAIHQAVVDVNEEGTEATAATGIIGIPTSAAPIAIPVFRADHPFMWMIQDRINGSILFLGRIITTME